MLSRDALAKLREGDGRWEAMCPPEAADLIKQRRLLGYASKLASAAA